MLRINLLPVREERKREEARRLASIFGLTVLALLLAMTMLQLKGLARERKLNRQLAEVKTVIDQHRKLQEEMKLCQARKAAIEQKLAVINDLKASKTGPVHILDELATRLPVKKLWFESLVNKGGSLEITGRAVNNKTIADYMRRLEGSAYFSKVDLVESQQKEISGVKVKDFTISCLLAQPKLIQGGEGK